MNEIPVDTILLELFDNLGKHLMKSETSHITVFDRNSVTDYVRFIKKNIEKMPFNKY